MSDAIVKCPECDGRGKVRDLAFAVFTLGISSLVGDDMDECDRCEGTGYIKKRAKK